MAKVIPINHFPKSSEFSNYMEYMKVEKQYFDELVAESRKAANAGQYVSRLCRFSVADGYAWYRVAKLRPLTLEHIPMGDAWHYKYIYRLTLSDIKAECDRFEALNRLFEKAV